MDTAVAFFTAALAVEEKHGVRVVHETHRQRLLFSPSADPAEDTQNHRGY